MAVEFRPWRFLLALAAAGAAVGGCRPPSPGAVGEPAAFSRTTGSAVQFTDRTEAAGLRFRHTNGAGGKRHLVETMGSGCAFLDADGDGWLDILLLNGRPLPHRSAAGRSFPALYRNQGDGTFRDVTDGSGLEVELYGMGCAVGDYDNDGRPDLYVSCALDESRLFHNEGGGHFRDVTSTAGVGNDRRWGASCAWVDYDQDGRLDLFVTNYLRYSLELEAPCLRAGQPIYCGPMAYPAERCRLYRNLGNGRFQDVSRAAGVDAVEGKSLGVAVWDFDGKNGPEILVANDVTPNFLFWNQGNGRFTEEGVVRGVAFAEDGSARAGMGIDVAQTGDAPGAAVLIANFSREPNTFLVQQPDGGFLDETYPSGMGTPSIPYLGFGLLLLDPDHDGLRDAVVANGHIEPDIARYEAPIRHAQPLLFLRNEGGRFRDTTARVGAPFSVPRVGRGLARADYDRDGDEDLLLTTNGGAAVLLRNELAVGKNWIRIRLVGKSVNRDGYGARVELTAGGRIQRDQCRSGGSYLSASDPALHFGLGRAVQADQVRVVWPGGKEETWTGLAGGSEYRLTEGGPAEPVVPASPQRR